jgi:hypothetical protein
MARTIRCYNCETIMFISNKTLVERNNSIIRIKYIFRNTYSNIRFISLDNILYNQRKYYLNERNYFKE